MAGSIVHLNSSNFKGTVEKGKTLVDFWANWCGPCRAQLPILEKLVARAPEDVTIAKLDVDEAGDVAGQFGVRSIPTLIIFKDGKEVQRFVGVQTEATLASALGI